MSIPAVRKYSTLKTDLPLVIIIAVFGTTLLVMLNAWDWLYNHSRQGGADYSIDEVVAFLSLFLLVGMLWLVFRMYRAASREARSRKKAEEALLQLNLELEQRIEQRTAQLHAELEERRRTEATLVENQRQLRTLSAELSLVEERERRRIAASLHDHIGQTLAMAYNQLGSLGESIGESIADGEKTLDEIKGFIKECIQFSRSLISELHSPAYDTLPFAAAVEWLAAEALADKGIRVNFKVAGQPEFAEAETRLLLLKAIREVLVNILKHAMASQVELSLGIAAGELLVEIRDDGVGFNTTAVSPAAVKPGTRGFGLFLVRERLAHLDGRATIVSTLGQGTSVTLAVPEKQLIATEHSTHGNQRPHLSQPGAVEVGGGFRP